MWGLGFKILGLKVSGLKVLWSKVLGLLFRSFSISQGPGSASRVPCDGLVLSFACWPASRPLGDLYLWSATSSPVSPKP